MSRLESVVLNLKTPVQDFQQLLGKSQCRWNAAGMPPEHLALTKLIRIMVIAQEYRLCLSNSLIKGSLGVKISDVRTFL